MRQGSPAARAGVQRGDVVTQLERRPIRSGRDFFEMLQSATPGQELRVDLLRQGEARSFAIRAEVVPDAVVAQILRERLGVELAPAEQGGYAVRAVRKDGGASRIVIQPVDRSGINGRPCREPKTFAVGARPLRAVPSLVVVNGAAVTMPSRGRVFPRLFRN